MSSPRTVSVALLTGCAVIFLLVISRPGVGKRRVCAASSGGCPGAGNTVARTRSRDAHSAAASVQHRSSGRRGALQSGQGGWQPGSRSATDAAQFANGATVHFAANGEGLFRIFPLAPGHYELNVEAAGAESFVLHDLALGPNEVVTLEISLAQTGTTESASRLPRLPELGPAPASESGSNGGNLSRTAAPPRFRSRLHSGARARLSASGCRCL